MKRVFLSLLMAVMGMCAWAQECIIPLGVKIDSDRLPEQSAQSLYNKMVKAITQDGIEGGLFSNFAVVTSIEEVQEETVAGTRPTYMKVIDLNLAVVNMNTQERFSTTSIRLTGSGNNSTRAFNACFAKLNGESLQISGMLKKAKNKIIAYYDSQANTIIAEAKKYTTQNQYEEALCLLVSVPTCCNSYAKIEKELDATFQRYVDFDCSTKVMKAHAIWAASQTKESATAAGAYLAAINPNSSCTDEAKELLTQIRSRMGEKWELEKQVVLGGMKLESERIEAARAIGVAYGQNQKATTYNDHWIVR